MTGTEALIESAKALREAARSHKRASAYHRRQAKEAMQRYAAVAQHLAQLGIGLVIEGERETPYGREKAPS